MNKTMKRSYKFFLLILMLASAVLFSFTIVRAQMAPSSPKKALPELPIKPLSAVVNPTVNGLSTYVANQASGSSKWEAMVCRRALLATSMQALTAGPSTRSIPASGTRILALPISICLR